MAEKVEIIDIDAGDATKTLKDLKDEVKNLRNELDGCVVGSEKFEKTLDELTTAQTELKNATKTSTDAIEGSYDALVAKMSELKKAWRATADEAERADLGSQIAEINSQLKTMDAEIGNYQRNVGDYGSAFDGVTLKIEGGVARFEKFNNASRAIIGSFDLVEGGLKAIGVESEEVNGLMNTMQGAMMFTNGLNSVKEGVQAFNALRTSVTAATAAQTALNAAQMANPIGLIVAGVAALVAGITALVTITGKHRDEEKLLQEQFEATNKVIEDRIAAQELEIQLMEARGESQADILAQEKAYAETNLQTTKDRIAAIEKELEDTGSLRFKKKKILNEQLEDLKETLAEQEQAVVSANNAILIYDTKTRTEQKKNAEKLAEETARLAKEKADKEIAEEKRKQAEIDKLNQTKLEKYQKLLDDILLSQMSNSEKQLHTIHTQYIQEEAFLQDLIKNKLISDEEYSEALIAIKEKETNAIKALEQGKQDAQSKTNESALDGVETLGEKIKKMTGASDEQFKAITDGVNLAGAAFGHTSQLLNTLAQQQDKTTKEGFEASKKMSIAAATMSMLQGVVAAWTSSFSLPMPIGAITAGIMTASTIAMGAAQIASIKKQKFEGGASDATVAPTVPNINTAALISTPINYTTEIQGAKAEEKIGDTRVYVVETDITDAVNRVKVAEDESTF